MIRRRLTTILFLLLLAARLAGQSGLALSGLGMMPPPADVGSQGQGNISAVPADRTDYLVSLPASWQNARATHLHASVGLHAASLGSFGKYSNVALQSLQFLAHLNNRTAYAIMLQPVTRLDARLQQDTTTVLFGGSVDYALTRAMEGGLSELTAGFSRRVIPPIALGLSLNILFGTLTQRDDLTILDPGSLSEMYPFSVTSERRLEFNGLTVGLSLLGDIGKEDRAEVGLQAVVPLGLDVSERRTYPQSLPEERIWHSGLALPDRLNLGVRVAVNDRQRLLAEAGLTRQSGERPPDLVFGRQLDETRALRLAWTRLPGRPDAMALDRLYYRVGFYRLGYYLSDLQNGPLVEFGLTLGTGYAAPKLGQKLDFALQIGRREGLLPAVDYEYFGHLSIGVTTTELWFVRPNKTW